MPIKSPTTGKYFTEALGEKFFNGSFIIVKKVMAELSADNSKYKFL